MKKNIIENIKKRIARTKKGKRRFLMIGAIVILIILAIIIALQNKKSNNALKEGYKIVETSYGDLNFPDKYSDNLYHEENTENNVTTEIFSIQLGETTTELFRICFGSKDIGDLVGYWNADTDEIPITTTVSNLTEADFESTEDAELYYAMRACVNDVLASIRSNEKFMENAGTVELKPGERNLTYWTVTIPEEISVEETSQGDTYIAKFVCNINGKDIPLYEVRLGQDTAESVLGTYTVDGQDKLVSVESYDLPSMDTWSEKDANSLYGMMGTINDVIQVIMNNENFSEESQPQT